MKTICVIALCFSSLSLYSEEEVKKTAEVATTEEIEDVVLWIGPGWYWGIWFESEIEFNDYRYHHH